MKAFDYHKPSSVPEAVALFASGSEIRPLAGGMSLLPTMKQRLSAPSALIDLAGIPALKGISVGADTITIGAMTRHVDVARSPEVLKALPALAQLAGGIGDPAVRNRGTIGGSLANNDPNADYPAAALALGATIVTSTREIAADQFFRGMFETALAPGELITAVKLPIPLAAGYAKMPKRKDPNIPVRVASVQTQWPGADADHHRYHHGAHEQARGREAARRPGLRPRQRQGARSVLGAGRRGHRLEVQGPDLGVDAV